MHAHLDLQVNMLTEQKVSKLIELIEELRRDLPMVKDRRNETAEALQEPADAHEMLQTLHEMRTEKRRRTTNAAAPPGDPIVGCYT